MDVHWQTDTDRVTLDVSFAKCSAVELLHFVPPAVPIKLRPDTTNIALGIATASNGTPHVTDVVLPPAWYNVPDLARALNENYQSPTPGSFRVTHDAKLLWRNESGATRYIVPHVSPGATALRGGPGPTSAVTVPPGEETVIAALHVGFQSGWGNLTVDVNGVPNAVDLQEATFDFVPPLYSLYNTDPSVSIVEEPQPNLSNVCRVTYAAGDAAVRCSAASCHPTLCRVMGLRQYGMQHRSPLIGPDAGLAETVRHTSPMPYIVRVALYSDAAAYSAVQVYHSWENGVSWNEPVEVDARRVTRIAIQVSHPDGPVVSPDGFSGTLRIA